MMGVEGKERCSRISGSNGRLSEGIEGETQASEAREGRKTTLVKHKNFPQ